jgi:hypothetical protein
MENRDQARTRLARLGMRQHAAKAAAVIVVIALGFFTREPALAVAEREQLRERFRFEVSQLTLPSQSIDVRHIRDVEPALERIRAWISSVGAGVALHDVSGDGLPNDACLIDPRIDQAILISVRQPPAYEPFVLSPQFLAFDAHTMAPMGCVPGDFNEDGSTDLLVYYWGRSPILFLRQADSLLTRSAFVEHELVQPFKLWNTNAVTSADIDGDGHIDLVIGNYFPDGARVLDVNARHDPRMQMQDSMSRAFNGGGDRVFLWQSPGDEGLEPSFTMVPEPFPAGIATGWTLALGAADLDGDLLPELYIANDFGPDRLLRNRSVPGRVRFEVLEGARTLTTPASKVLGHDSFKGMGIDFGDLSGDGLLDMFVSNITADFALHESNFAFINTGELSAMDRGGAPYRDDSERLGLARSGWAWDTKIADFDNSGRPEIIQATGFVRGDHNRWAELQELAMGNDTLLRHQGLWPRFAEGDDLSGRQHNPFFVQGPDGRFFDLAVDVGLGAPYVTRGIAVADIDGDGRQDFAWANQWEPSQLFRNRCHACGGFLGLDLYLPVGAGSGGTTVLPGRRGGELHGRPAIGAEVTVLTRTRTHVAQVDGGNGHSGRRSPEIHIGLGDEVPVAVEIRYRDRQGIARHTTLDLGAGWHTVMLDSDEERGP